MQPKYKYLIAVLGMAAGIGCLTGGALLYITWEHNPQCEFHCNGEIQWQTWLPYGLIGGVIGVMGGVPLILMCTMAMTLRRRRAG